MATIPATDDVEETLTGIMAKQSPLMKQARTQGIQQAQKAGLGQSTMAIKAAQAAAYQAALPIASQQAQQVHQKATQASQFGHETGLQQAGFKHAASQAELDRSLDFNKFSQSQAQQAHQFSSSMAHEQQQKHAERELDIWKSQLSQQSQERMASMQVAGQNKQVAMQAFASFQSSYDQLIANLHNNENIPADVRAHYLDHYNNIKNSNFNLVQSLYNTPV